MVDHQCFSSLLASRFSFFTRRPGFARTKSTARCIVGRALARTSKADDSTPSAVVTEAPMRDEATNYGFAVPIPRILGQFTGPSQFMRSISFSLRMRSIEFGLELRFEASARLFELSFGARHMSY